MQREQDWKGNPLKSLSTSKRRKSAGRSSSGVITIFHRGGGSKRLLRTIDFKRNPLIHVEQPKHALALTRDTNSWCKGVVERIEYDPNRSSQIALVRWSLAKDYSDESESASRALKPNVHHTADLTVRPLSGSTHNESCALFTYILAYDQIKLGDRVLNIHGNNSRTNQRPDANYLTPGNCTPLHMIPVGTLIHNIELNPKQGAKLVRSAGTFAQVVQQSNDLTKCVVRLPSNVDKQIDSQCRATIGIVSNGSHSSHKLSKAGHNRWLGKRPVVRGVAMNPIDHPHGGGEGRTKGGRPSVSPWGKPTKGGFKTALKKHKS